MTYVRTEVIEETRTVHEDADDEVIEDQKKKAPKIHPFLVPLLTSENFGCEIQKPSVVRAIFIDKLRGGPTTVMQNLGSSPIRTFFFRTFGVQNGGFSLPFFLCVQVLVKWDVDVVAWQQFFSDVNFPSHRHSPAAGRHDEVRLMVNEKRTG